MTNRTAPAEIAAAIEPAIRDFGKAVACEVAEDMDEMWTVRVTIVRHDRRKRQAVIFSDFDETREAAIAKFIEGVPAWVAVWSKKR